MVFSCSVKVNFLLSLLPPSVHGNSRVSSKRFSQNSMEGTSDAEFKQFSMLCLVPACAVFDCSSTQWSLTTAAALNH